MINNRLHGFYAATFISDSLMQCAASFLEITAPFDGAPRATRHTFISLWHWSSDNNSSELEAKRIWATTTG